MNLEIILGISGMALCIIAGISFYIQNKRLKESGNEDKLKGPMPWWYYLGCLIAGILIFGPFSKVFNFFGSACLFLLMGLAMKYKMK